VSIQQQDLHHEDRYLGEVSGLSKNIGYTVAGQHGIHTRFLQRHVVLGSQTEVLNLRKEDYSKLRCKEIAAIA
jgi:hypothetical protein